MSTRIIKINRGDSFSFNLRVPSVADYNKNHTLANDEVVYFALLYPHQPFEEAILIKGYTSEDQDADSGEISIEITPNDTRNLAPGIYYYTIKVFICSLNLINQIAFVI